MNAAPKTGQVNIAATHLHEFITASGVEASLTMLLERFAGQSLSLEQYWDRHLDIQHLFALTPWSEALQLKLLEQLDGLDASVVVRASASQAVCGHAELLPASTRSETLAAIAHAWARSLCWLLDSAALQPMDRLIAQIEIEVLDASCTNVPQLLCWEKQPSGAYVNLDERVLAEILQQIEDDLRTRSATAPILTAARDAAFVRYACGALYNQRVLPPQAFAFFATLVQPATMPFKALKQMAQQATVLEDQLISQLFSTDPQSIQITTTTVRPQQLIGSPSATGQAHGRVRYVHTGEPDTVLVCQRLSSAHLHYCPVAVVEHQGGCTGLGAQLARQAGLPCVSGISDLTPLPEYTPVSVDGDLGLVTVRTDVRSGRSFPRE